jgi:SMODS-associating 2TM, beta-strand rich effector domain
MWALIPRKTQVLILAGLAIVLAWGIEGAAGLVTSQPPSELKLISLIASVISVVGGGIASASWRWVWRRFPVIGRKTFPDLSGTWEGTLVSTWKDPATGKGVPPIPVTIWIRQGLFSTSIKLGTGESTSFSTRCLLEADRESGRFRFWYSYDNTPRAAYRHRSARHEGVAWLELDIGTDPSRLIGCYYTDRKTSGDIDVRRTGTAIESTAIPAAA